MDDLDKRLLIMGYIKDHYEISIPALFICI